MQESQEDIDALLAEVNALADEAVADIVAEGGSVKPITPSPGPGETPTSAKTGSGVGAAPASPAPPPQFAPPAAAFEDPKRILNLEVPVIVQLAERTMPLSEIMTISTGAIIEFEKPADSELDLMINNQCIGQGQAVKVGENFGLRITEIGSVRSRIKAMGNQ